MGPLQKLFGGMRIASTGLKAERARVDTIAKNIANSQVTKVESTGEAYRREFVNLAPIVSESKGGKEIIGVEVRGTRPDMQTPFQEVRDPGHPDADAEGIVRYPNVNTVKEMADLITAVRAYEANLTIQKNAERMAERSLRMME